jgi:hypothetical protein
MDALILITVVIGTLLAITSGIWVAIALVSAISGYKDKSDTHGQENNKVSD